jgi:hypothetical protein
MEKPTKPITKGQTRAIHTLVNALGLTEGDYRITLWHNFKVVSSSFLNSEQASELIETLKEKAVMDGVWTAREGSNKYEDLGCRSGMATPAQLRKIETIWREIASVKTQEGRQSTLRTFLSNRFHVSDLRFIQERQVTGILNAMRQMRSRQKTGVENCAHRKAAG